MLVSVTVGRVYGMERLRLALRGPETARLPIGEMLHPITLAAVILLAVNDWLLKPSLVPHWLTGKLSDVTGLIVAPLFMTALVGLLLRVIGKQARLTQRRLLLAIASVAIVFIAVKSSQGSADFVVRIWRIVFTHARIVADPTDLLALPALAIAWWIGRDEIRRS